MATYNIYPSVDENYNFPPEIMSVLTDKLASWRGFVTSSMTQASLETGIYGVTSESNGAGIKAPARGTLHVAKFGSYGGSMMLVTEGSDNPQIHISTNTSTGWGEWFSYDGNFSSKPIRLMDGDHADTMTNGSRSVWSGTDAEGMGLPTNNLGILRTALFGNAGIQLWIPSIAGSETGEIWIRYRTTGGWLDWRLMNPQNQSGETTRGFKVVPLSVTTSTPAANASSVATYRVPLKYNAPITRWRVCMSLTNMRSNTVVGSNVKIDGVWIGDHAGNGAFASAPTQVVGAVTLPNDGSIWKSKSITAELGGNLDKLLSYSYDSVTGPPVTVSGGWRSAAKVGNILAPTLTKTNAMGIEVWIEAETYEDTPVISVFGDSLSSGAAASLAVYDSVISVKARELGALPIHWSISSDSMTGWEDPDEMKWTRWKGLALADSVIFAMAHNDIYGLDVTYTEAVRLFKALLVLVEERISPNVYVSTITPRSAGSAAEHAVRNQYNTFLKGEAQYLVRDVFDFDAVISVNNVIKAEYDGDGIHLNSLGYQAEANTITRPISARPRTTLSTKVGKTVTFWDPTTKSETMVFGDTGVRSLPVPNVDPLNGTGTITISRTGNEVTLVLDRVEYIGTDSRGYLTDPGFIPTGFRPGYSENPTGIILNVNANSTYPISVLQASRIRRMGPALVGNEPGLASDAFRGIMRWRTTDPWPTSLPGVPA